MVKWPTKYPNRYIFVIVCFLKFTRAVTQQLLPETFAMFIQVQQTFLNARDHFLNWCLRLVSISKTNNFRHDMLREEMEANPCQTIQKLSNALNQTWSIIQEHLQQIGKVSSALSEENRANRCTTCNLLLQCHNTEAIFDRLVTGDEKWVFYYNAKRKKQWLSKWTATKYS